ncbi:ABC transporter substrate-binding protein [Aestuariibacter sp. A3R04]|uniref:ABC transporter substrate-binding protein n=1 Tax=Aestuariibacter sp. A3R04 TaxID=2841571 RepID=UPI001C09E0E0|nr:ABC transporter substrate-binding protein [Aestuariibacter sp. A3R04]MBU3020897.1 ABC transporter substrate-binding protein [Aestuariibacter sp. A3R04]
MLFRFTSLLLSIALCSLMPVQGKPQVSTPIVIALDADMSAVAVDGGVAIARGAKLAIDEINEAGGILGQPLELVTFDHRGNPARGISNIKQIAAMKGVLAVLGGVHTPVALAELDAIHGADLIYVSPWAAGTSVVENDLEPNNVFRVSISDEEASKVLIQYARNRSLTKIALVLERTGWGRSNLESLTREAQAQNVEITTVHWINWRQADFGSELEVMLESGAQGLVLVANSPEAVTVSQAVLASDRSSLPVISHWGLASGDYVSSLGLENVSRMDVSVIQTFSFLKQNHARAKALLQRYFTRYGPDKPQAIPAAAGLAHSYDCIHLLALAAEKAGGINAAKIRQSLENLPPFTGAVKTYAPAFSDKARDALMAKDFFMTTFDSNGHLVPIANSASHL